MNTQLPDGFSRATFADLYSEVELQKAALRVYTRPLFAWRKALSRSNDGLTLYDFARHGQRNLDRLHHQLASHAFQFRPGKQLHYNFNGKRRVLNIFPWEERIVDVMLYRVLNGNFHSALSPYSYAYRSRGFGVDPCQHSLSRILNSISRPVFFVRRDIRNYFPSIPHDLLLAMLAEWVADDDYLFDLLEQRVRYLIQDDDGDVAAARSGVPFGTAIACFLANLYLNPVDRIMEEMTGVFYFRYADDMLLFSDDRARAAVARDALDAAIADLGLASKPSHHQSFSFANGGNATDDEFPVVPSFRHLGLQFRDDGSIGLARDKSRKIQNQFRYAFRRAKRKFKHRRTPEERARLACEIARELVTDSLRSVAIIDYYLKHVDDEKQLRLLDRWLAEEVLSLALGKGHKKGNFKKISFARLREMGLPSLRHRRRLLRHRKIESSFFTLRTEKLIEKERRRLSSRKSERSKGFSSQLKAAALESS